MLLQFAQQLIERRGAEFGTELDVRRRHVAQTLKVSLEIKSGAAAENGHPSAGLDVRLRAARQHDKLRHVERLGQFHHVDEMMRHAGTFPGRRFGRAKV